MQHLRWERHGRTYSHADEGQPQTYTYTTAIGQSHVDLHGDGSEYAPYAVDADGIRHGESELTLTGNAPGLTHLGQALISRSTLTAWRQQASNWVEITLGAPTRNIQPDFPAEGRVTAYLDFPSMTGYAQGNRCQIGVEVGGSEQATFGFRFRSSAARTVRLQWRLELPSNAPLEWIDDEAGTHHGAILGPVRIIWSEAEAPFRAATVADDGAGGKILTVTFGPYALTAMQWLTVYPDVITPAIGADNRDGFFEGTSESLNYINYDYMGNNGSNDQQVALEFPLTGPASGNTINAATVTITINAKGGTSIPNTRIRIADSDTVAVLVGTHGHNVTTHFGSFSATTLTNWAIGDTTGSQTSPDIAALVQVPVNRAGWASGNYIGLVLDIPTAWIQYYKVNDYAAGSGSATMSVTYTAGEGAAAISTGRIVGTDLPMVGAGPSTRLVVS